MPCQASGIDLKKAAKEKTRVWFCHVSSRQLSSEQVASEFQKAANSSVKELQIMIGPADGFKEEDMKLWKPELLWSFGSLTLPHELASVVASEQVYRALTILNHLPYHQGHL